jgi:hypothetical protein
VAEFFVPHTTSAKDAEQAYAVLAALANFRILPLEERIFAITWHADAFD